MNLLNFTSFLPEIAALFLLLTISVLRFFDSKNVNLYKLSFSSASAIMILLIVQQFFYSPHFYFSGNLAFDSFGSCVKLLIAISVVAGALIDLAEKDQFNESLFVIYALILFSSFTALSSNNLLLTFVSFEVLNLAIINLMRTGLPVSSLRQYYRSWIISSSLMLFGISLLYGLFGSLNFSLISYYISGSPVNTLTLTFSVLLVFSGFAMKLFIFPLQSVVTNIFSSLSAGKLQIVILSSIISGSGALVRFMNSAFNDWNAEIQTTSQLFNWELFLTVYFIITVLSSSLILYLQKETSKTLLFFIIINSNFLLISVFKNNGAQAGNYLFYLIFVVVSTTGLIFVCRILNSHFRIPELKDLKGLYRSAPPESLFLILILLSLSGMPLTMGFAGKLYIFSQLNSALFTILSSLVSIFVSSLVIYGLIVDIFSRVPEAQPGIRSGTTNRIILAVILIAIVLPGIFPGPLKDAVDSIRILL